LPPEFTWVFLLHDTKDKAINTADTTAIFLKKFFILYAPPKSRPAKSRKPASFFSGNAGFSYL
jgi:hypothetical protein